MTDEKYNRALVYFLRDPKNANKDITLYDDGSLLVTELVCTSNVYSFNGKRFKKGARTHGNAKAK